MRDWKFKFRQGHAQYSSPLLLFYHFASIHKRTFERKRIRRRLIFVNTTITYASTHHPHIVNNTYHPSFKQGSPERASISVYLPLLACIAGSKGGTHSRPGKCLSTQKGTIAWNTCMQSDLWCVYSFPDSCIVR